MPKPSSIRIADVIAHIRSNPKDVKYIFSLPILLSAIGAAGLAIIGVQSLRDQVKVWIPDPIWEWGNSNAILVVLLFGLLTVFPVLMDRLASKILLKKRLLRKNTELSTAAATFTSRTAHLITKTQDSILGEQDGRYIQHTLIDCCKYFKQRSIQLNGTDPDAQVDAILLQVILDKGGRPTRLERKQQTHQTTGDFAPQITKSRNALAAELLEGLIVRREPVFSSSDKERDSLLTAMKLETVKYREFLIVPVLIDRKIDGSAGVWGALMLMAESQGTLRKTDREILNAFAWFCSAALAVDRAVRSLK